MIVESMNTYNSTPLRTALKCTSIYRHVHNLLLISLLCDPQDTYIAGTFDKITEQIYWVIDHPIIKELERYRKLVARLLYAKTIHYLD